MLKRVLASASIAAGVFAFAGAEAAPIAYTDLANGVPAAGVISSTATSIDPAAAVYFRFFAEAGASVTVTGERLEDAFDMAFWLFEGAFSDTDDFDANFDDLDAGFIAFGDDEIAHPGPFGDPQVQFVAPSTGPYTVAVVNFASGDPGEDGVFSFQVVANNIADVPEPGIVGLFGVALASAGLLARPRRR